MKTRKWRWLLFLLAVTLLASYISYTSTRIRQLEVLVGRLEADRRNQTGQGVRYGFDESFIKYFGDQGAAEVGRAVKILEDQTPPPKQSHRF